jgi:putative transposase
VGSLYDRRPERDELAHHSDRGSQYASQVFQDKPTEYGMKCSMTREDNCWGNAVAESFFNNLKNERVHGRRYATRDEARADVFDYIETFYNRSRRHSALLGKTPASVFEAWVLKQQEEMAA